MPNEKLSPIFYGPYQIVERIGQVVYSCSFLNTVVFISFSCIITLKPAVHSLDSSQPLPPMLSEVLEVTPEKLLDTRTNSLGKLEVLLKWHQLPETENSWESAASISKEFPDFHLEDKVSSWAGY